MCANCPPPTLSMYYEVQNASSSIVMIMAKESMLRAISTCKEKGIAAFTSDTSWSSSQIRRELYIYWQTETTPLTSNLALLSTHNHRTATTPALRSLRARRCRATLETGIYATRIGIHFVNTVDHTLWKSRSLASRAIQIESTPSIRSITQLVCTNPSFHVSFSIA